MEASMGVDKRDELLGNPVAPQAAAQPVHQIDPDFQVLPANGHALGQLVQNLPGMIVAYDQSGYLRFVNSRVIEYFGEDPSDRAGFAWGDYVHADDSEGLRDAWHEGIRAPREMSLSYRLRRADGTYRWFECRVQPLFNGRKEVLHWYGLLTDVDDRRVAEANLQEPRQSICRLLDAIPGMHFVMSPEGMPEIINQNLLDALGVSLEKTRRDGFKDLIHPDHQQLVTDAWTRSLSTGEPMSLEYLSVDRGGPWRWIHTHVEPFRSVEGQICWWYGSVVDIDDRKRAEEAMRNSEYRLRTIVEAIPALVWTCTPDGRLDYLNTRLIEYTGRTVESFEKHGWIDLLHPADRECTRQKVTEYLRIGRPYTISYRMRGVQETYRWFEVRSEPLRDNEGRIEHWYGVHIDIDDRRQLEDALRQSQTKLARAAQVAAVAEMAASIAHEINQPLAAIAANGDAGRRWLLSDPPNLHRLDLCLKKISRDTDAAAEVVKRIRSLFKEAVPQKAPLDLNELIKEVLELMADEIDRRAVFVEEDLDSQLASTLADKVQIQQVITNLLQNSLEALAEGVSGAKRILIRSRGKCGNIVIEICDNGSGFEDSDRLFEAFFTTKPEGMGIGLAICKSIVEAHGGSIWATRIQPVGAAFTFSLPILDDDRSSKLTIT